MWLFQVIRNIKHFWLCSKLRGGSLDGYLTPTGWQAVGGEYGMNGVYTVQEDAASMPVMAILKKAIAGQMVVAVRGSNTKAEWARNFMYDRLQGHPFTGEPFDASSFAGEVHRGFSVGFDGLWPAVQAALKSQVLGGDHLASIMFAGHSQGGALSTLLAYGAATYLNAMGLSAQVSLVTFGSPHVGDSKFRKSFTDLNINSRRITFENDPFPYLPCVSKPSAGAASMPICPNVAVPTYPSSNTKDSKLFINDYQPIPGQLLIKASGMKVQTDAWQQTNHIMMNRAGAAMDALHSCSYICCLRGYSQGATTDNNCLLRRVSNGSPLLAANGYCQNYPLDVEDWPRLSLDRQLFEDSSSFPDAGARPPMYTFRGYDSAKSWSCTRNPANGVLSIMIQHNDIPAVTPSMMAWLFNNLQGSSASPLDGKVYPRFLLMHPRDHILHLASAKPLSSGKGKRWTTWQEIQATGCVAQPGNNAAPYVCPSGMQTPNPGVTKSDAPSYWENLDQVNSNSTVLSFTRNSIELGVQGCKGSTCAWTVRTKHTWSAAPGQTAALRLTTNQDIGIKLALAKKVINPKIIDAWRNGVDADKKCRRVALHMIEEFGGLEHWLPSAFMAAQ